MNRQSTQNVMEQIDHVLADSPGIPVGSRTPGADDDHDMDTTDGRTDAAIAAQDLGAAVVGVASEARFVRPEGPPIIAGDGHLLEQVQQFERSAGSSRQSSAAPSRRASLAPEGSEQVIADAEEQDPAISK